MNEKHNTELSYSEIIKIDCEIYNNSKGDLKGIDCQICNNKGYIMYIEDNDYQVLKECECIISRKIKNMIANSGLSHLLTVYTLGAYKSENQWQKVAKTMALEFINNHSGNWFFAGGQVGSGKTHICTAIVKELLDKSIPCKYMLWREEVVKLKAIVTEEEEYAREINRLKHIDVLYIDDFFKTDRRGLPTSADINIAFELLNYRYNNRLTTIISSEMLIDELLDIDEAIGSRIYQMSKGYCLSIGYDKEKNYRLRGD